MFIAPRSVPPWLECASSMMIAKRRSAMLVADLVEDERELLHGGDDDLLAVSMNLRRSPECSAWPTVAPTWANCLIVSRICLSRMRRSVTTMIESNTVRIVLAQADQLMRQPGDGVGLAAARRVLDQIAPPGAAARRRRPAACAPRRAGG